MTDEEKHIFDLIVNDHDATPVVYEDRIRISRSKFESLFGWKTACELAEQSEADFDASCGSGADNPLMPECITEIMRENQVTVMPSFRRRIASDQGQQMMDDSSDYATLSNNQQQQQQFKNKRDYILRIFGSKENDVASAKFKIQSAVHQVAVMGSNSQVEHPGVIGSNESTSLPQGENRANQWWANVNDRLTLRIDVDYSVHSHLIGRSGGNIASVMRATQTHIHFPDSNKQTSASVRSATNGSRSASPSSLSASLFSQNPPVKNNYVTISGPAIDQVEEARQYIRRMTPLRLAIPFSTLQVPLSITGQVFVPARLAASSRRIMQEFSDRGLSATMRSDSLVVSGTVSTADLVIQATQQICLEVYECLVPVSLSIDVTPRDWAFVRGPGDCYTRKVEHTTGCQFLFPNQSEDFRNSEGRRHPIRIIGFPANAVKARLLLQSRLPIQLSWPFRSYMAAAFESDAALKEIVATKYDIFLSMRDRNTARNGMAPPNRDSGSATPESSMTKFSSRTGSGAAYHVVQPKHVVLKSYEGNLANVYRFHAHMRDLAQSSTSRASSRVDDVAPPTPSPTPAWWSPVPCNGHDDDMFNKVEALVQSSYLIAARTSATAQLTSPYNFGNVMPQADPQAFYYALAMAQQQQQQQSAILSSVFANNSAQALKTENLQRLQQQGANPTERSSESPHSDRSSPDSQTSGSLENYNIIIDDKSATNSFLVPSQPQKQRSVSSMSTVQKEPIVEARPITAAARPIFGHHVSFDSSPSQQESANDRLLEQFAASLSRVGSSIDGRTSAVVDPTPSPLPSSSGAVVISAESHKCYEIPRRKDPISSGILSSVGASQPLNNIRVPTSNNCGLLFSLSQPHGLPATTPSPDFANFGASSITDAKPMSKSSPKKSDPMSSMIGDKLLPANGSQGRQSFSTTGGFSSKLQTTELYYEQFADLIDPRLGPILVETGIAKSDIGKLASQEVRIEAFMTMSDSDLRDCGIWQLGVRKQLLRIIANLHFKSTSSKSSNPVIVGVDRVEMSSPIDRPASSSDPLPLSVNNKSNAQVQSFEATSTVQQAQPQQQQQQQLPPQSPPFFASLKTYRLESEFRLL